MKMFEIKEEVDQSDSFEEVLIHNDISIIKQEDIEECDVLEDININDDVPIIKQPAECKDCKKYKEENCKLKSEIKSQNIQISNLYKKLNKSKKSLMEVRDLNCKWQENGLANIEEIHRLLGEINKKNNDGRVKKRQNDHFQSEYEVGYINSGGKDIHLGRNIWLPIQTYTFVTANIKSISQLTRNLTRALFTEQTLLTSTVTGKSAQKKRKVTNSATPAPLRLDPIKVLAIKDFVRYYMIEEWKYTEDEADTEADLVRHYISKKIAELKEVSKPGRKIRNKFSNSNTNDNENVISEDFQKIDEQNQDSNT